MKRTGDCFNAALFYLMNLYDKDQAEGYTLVHGVVTNPLQPHDQTFVHAWIERASGDRVIDVSNGCVSERPRAGFYSLVNANHIVRYTVNDATLNNGLSGHSGPWDQFLSQYSEIVSG